MIFLKHLIKRFFQWQARLVLKKYSPKIIAISGSVGKSSTRTSLYQVLSKKFFVRKNERSFTSELGIPLAIIGCSQGSGSILHWIQNIFVGMKLLSYTNQYPDILILELDCDKPGDLTGLSWLKPDMLILTAIGEIPAHIESFETIEKYIYEHNSLIDSVGKDGCIIYNADDEMTSHMVFASDVRTVSCGLSGDVSIQGNAFEILYETIDTRTIPTGMSFDIIPAEEKISIIGSVGIHNEYACLLAYAAGLELGLTSREILTRLSGYKTLPGRMNIILGIKESVIIDDTYNASHIAMQAALNVLDEITTKQKKRSGSKPKKIAVIGDMFELGKYSTDEHRKLAHNVFESATHAITVGIRSKVTAEELLSLGFEENNLLQADTSREAGTLLQALICEGDVILVKGSQAMRMERVVEEVMLHPEDKSKLLVRQESEWTERE